MNKIISAALVVFALSACNLYGGIGKPSSDPQYLLAARSCLDQGDYACAKENYQALSSSYSDIEISEMTLTVLAENKIFSIADLIGSLGSSLGGASSFSSLSELMASRGVTTGTYRTTLKTQYDLDASIANVKLRAFTKFLVSLSLFNQILANAVGADGKLTASDLVTSANVTACKNGTGSTDDCSNTGSCILSGTCLCTAPSGTSLTYDAADTSSLTDAASATNDWSGNATIQKLLKAASEASNNYTVFSGGSSSQGLLKTIQDLASISAAEPCTRKLLLQYLSL